MKLSPVATLYSAGAVLMSACCKYRLVDGLRKSKVTMSYRAVKGGEYWRLGTSMFLFDLENPLDIYTLIALFTCLSALEQKFFKGSAMSMLGTLAFVASALFVPGFYFRELRLKEPSVMLFAAIATWATVRCFFHPSAGMSAMATALGPLIPVVVPHFRKADIDMALLTHQGMAIAAGLACALLVSDIEGARVVRQQRQKAAKKAQGANAGAGAGAGAGAQVAPVDDSSSSDEEEEEEDLSSEEEEEEDSD